MSNANAWDDDWASLADKPSSKPVSTAPPKKLSQAERRAQHAAFQKELWESAENPAPAPMFLAVKEETPLQGDFKPAMKLLSRKPPPKNAVKGGVSSQMGNRTLEDDDDSEEERRKDADAIFKERQAKATLDREEKQRRYDQRRAELLGTASKTEDNQGRATSNNRQSRGKGKGRGQPHRNGDASSSTDQSPARGGVSKKGQLFEPSYSPKPNSVFVQRRAGEDSRSRPATPGDQQQQPIRSPRNPDSSGRGGFGFSPRGNKSGDAV